MLPFLKTRMRYAAIIFGAMLIGAWLQSDLRAQRTAEQSGPPADECVGCEQVAGERPQRIMVPVTGDAAVDAANLDAAQQYFAARRRQSAEEAAQKLREKQKIWQGTSAELHPRSTPAQRESAEPFLELFAQDVPAPKVRQQHFAAFLKPDSPDRCVGWDLRLRSAIEVDDGWLVDVEAQVNLVPGDAISFGTTNEVWHVNFGGELTFVEGSPGEEIPARVDARP